MISIIIPTFNEEETIGGLLDYLMTCPGIGEAEIIVSDGGSTDKTRQIVLSKQAVFISSHEKGRAAQMNSGARQAGGNMLYFLHADTFPPASFINDIEAGSKSCKAGCFRLRFDDPHPLLRVYSWFTRFDIDYFRFGDQSLFVEKKLFKEIKGYDERLKVMEDQHIVTRLKKHTGFLIINNEVTTSARKYRQIGVVKLQFIFTLIVIKYYLGARQDELLKFYRKQLT